VIRWRPSQELVVLVSYAVGLYMSSVDNTIIYTALPTVARDFHEPLAAAQWVTLSYLLALAMMIPSSGWIGDRFGTRRTFLIALVLFTGSSALCGLSGSLTQLVIFRLIQGIGGGLIMMPALIYLIGVPTHIAVGTDLFNVAISGLYGAATYSYKGRVELVAALIMLCGAAVGAQIGTVATKYVKGYGIRIFFGFAVVGCGVSVIMKLLSGMSPAIKPFTDQAATILIFGVVSAISLYILISFFKGVRNERAQRPSNKTNSAHAD